VDGHGEIAEGSSAPWAGFGQAGVKHVSYTYYMTMEKYVCSLNRNISVD